MEIITSGITANLTEADVNEAIVDFMAKNGHEVKAEEIEYTMGRNPKQLKVCIVTGNNGQKTSAGNKLDKILNDPTPVQDEEEVSEILLTESTATEEAPSESTSTGGLFNKSNDEQAEVPAESESTPNLFQSA